jgi:hypothetical protein
MAQFGWAYVNCGDVTGSGTPGGANTEIQFNDNGEFSGSSNFTFNKTTNIVTLDGDLTVTGEITASVFVTDRTELITGSTLFGNNTTDTHIRTGSFFVGPSASAPTFQVDVSSNQSKTLGMIVGYRSITSAGTSSTSDYIIGIGGGNGDLEYRIHSASVAGTGSILVIKDENSSRTGSIFVSASSGETIDGESFYKLSGSTPAINLYSNGSNWFVF